MELKSFYADTVREALMAARRDLGPDAMFVSSRRSPGEWKHCGAYEVVCTNNTLPAVASQVSQTSHAGNREQDAKEDCLLSSYYRRQLIDLGFDTCLAGRIAAAAQTRGLRTVANPRRWRKEAPTRLLHLKEELESRIRTDEPWATEEGLLRPLAFVGPSGSGKTTLAVKLAAKWDVEYGITPLLIAADASKPGAACRLQRLSGIQGLPCEAIDSPQQLVRAVESGLAHGPVFVDTLALRGTGRNQEDWSDVLRAVRAHVLLVMPATLKPADMSRTVTLYQDLKPCAIAFTHLDETSTFGSCVGEALSTRLPIAYLSHGAEIPRDFTVAEPGSVVSCLFSSIQQIHSAPVGH